jgi:hypothetical protein
MQYYKGSQANKIMFTIDVWQRRKELQDKNRKKALEVIGGYYSEKQIRKAVNDKALDSALEYFEMSLAELLGNCSENQLFAKSVSLFLAVQSSRQGAILEKEIVNGIAEFVSSYGIEMRQAKNNKELRPMKTGGALTSEEFSKLGKDRKQSSLKSIDAFITAPFEAYIFAKVRTGVGGHQDNVDQEAHTFIDWALNEPSDKKYILLIDGDRNDKLYARQTDNVWVYNHIELQERLIEYVGK